MFRAAACSLALLVLFTVHAAADEKPDPAFAAWYYPGATSHGSSTTAGKLHQALLTTKDDIKKIEIFYMKQAQDEHADAAAKAKDEPPFGIHTSQGYPHPKDKTKYVNTIWADDSETHTDGAPRGVTLRSLVYDSNDEFVTVAYSRTPGEKTSHILVTVMKKK
jgi:hypothetical protein